MKTLLQFSSGMQATGGAPAFAPLSIRPLSHLEGVLHQALLPLKTSPDIPRTYRRSKTRLPSKPWPALLHEVLPV